MIFENNRNAKANDRRKDAIVLGVIPKKRNAEQSQTRREKIRRSAASEYLSHGIQKNTRQKHLGRDPSTQERINAYKGKIKPAMESSLGRISRGRNGSME